MALFVELGQPDQYSCLQTELYTSSVVSMATQLDRSAPWLEAVGRPADVHERAVTLPVTRQDSDALSCC
jgi:hypothetical protein